MPLESRQHALYESGETAVPMAHALKDSAIERGRISYSGAGELRPNTNEEDERVYEKLLALLTFGVRAERDGNGTFSITVAFAFENGTAKPEVVGEHTFHNVPLSDTIKAFVDSTGESLVSRADLETVFGIQTHAFRFTVGDDVSEWRLYVRRVGTDEVYVVTTSHNDHWQSSHSHLSYEESYEVLRGRLILVSETDGLFVFAVHVIEKTENGYREAVFSYNGLTNTVENVRISESADAPTIHTMTGVPHNVFLSENAVIGTAKVPNGTSVSGEDWKPEPVFDASLNTGGYRGLIPGGAMHHAIITAANMVLR